VERNNGVRDRLSKADGDMSGEQWTGKCDVDPRLRWSDELVVVQVASRLGTRPDQKEGYARGTLDHCDRLAASLLWGLRESMVDPVFHYSISGVYHCNYFGSSGDARSRKTFICRTVNSL
jgi:hypothetical protein